MGSTVMMAIGSGILALAVGFLTAGFAEYQKEKAVGQQEADQRRDDHAERMEKIRTNRALIDRLLVADEDSVQAKAVGKLDELKRSIEKLRRLNSAPPQARNQTLSGRPPAIGDEIDFLMEQFESLKKTLNGE
ncbi:MAG TPA: hypothetical protein VI072_01445 [Polyangiaceae bacterium]